MSKLKDSPPAFGSPEALWDNIVSLMLEIEQEEVGRRGQETALREKLGLYLDTLGGWIRCGGRIPLSKPMPGGDT